MTQPVSEFPAPLTPFTSRFPLPPGSGRVTPRSVLPSGPAAQPFGRRCAVRPVEPIRRGAGGHVLGFEPDAVHYLEMGAE